MRFDSQLKHYKTSQKITFQNNCLSHKFAKILDSFDVENGLYTSHWLMELILITSCSLKNISSRNLNSRPFEIQVQIVIL